MESAHRTLAFLIKSLPNTLKLMVYPNFPLTNTLALWSAIRKRALKLTAPK